MSRFAVVLLLLLALVAPARVASAAPGLPADVCGGVEVRAGTDGVVRGFASGTCSQAGLHDGAVAYLERRAGAWSWQPTPWTGRVLGVADNGRETFLMYENAGGMRVTKRGHDGTFAGPGWRLDSATAGGDVTVLGDGFLAVWVRPAGSALPLDLVSWGRYGGYIHPRTVVTGNSVPDLDPTLVTPPAPPGARPTAYLAWTRVFADRSEVRFAQGSPDVGWVSRRLAGLGTHNGHADLALGPGSGTWVSWARDGGQWGSGRAMVATDESDAFRSVTLPGSAAGSPQVAVGSAPVLPVVGYAVPAGVVLAWRSVGVWQSRTVATGAQASGVADVAVATVDARGSREATVLHTGAPDASGNAPLRATSVLFTPGAGG